MPWGVIELKKLGLLDTLLNAGGLFGERSLSYEENTSGDAASPHVLRFADVVPEVPGGLCMGHPAMCRALGGAARQAGVTVLTGVEGVEVTAGTPPRIAFSHAGRRIEWMPRLIVGADGRNSQVRHQLGFEVKADPPHNLLGGMLVDGVPGWPQEAAFGTEDRIHFLVFGQGGDRVRLYLCYDFADKQTYGGPDRQHKLIAAFARLSLPQAGLIAASRPIGPFNSFSNEDHWVEDPTASGVVLIGDAAGHNDPVTGQGLAIAVRDARLVSEIVLAGRFERAAFRPYVEERLERMRRLRIAARFATRLRVEFGPDARARRARASARMRQRMPSPLLALSLIHI